MLLATDTAGGICADMAILTYFSLLTIHYLLRTAYKMMGVFYIFYMTAAFALMLAVALRIRSSSSKH